MNTRSITAPASQGGVVLIVALVFLMVLTVAGLSAMRLSNVEERMTANYGERNLAFQAAEAALVQAETYLDDNDFDTGNFWEENNGACIAAGEPCFSNACANGHCFFGQYTDDTGDSDTCVLDSVNPENEIHQDSTTWDPSNNMILPDSQVSMQIGDGGSTVNASAVLEFRCFAILDAERSISEANDNRFGDEHWEPLYRITAYAEGRQGGARVMLQSIYRVD